MACPHNKTKTVASINIGPKGILDVNFFLLVIRDGRAKIIPIQEATNNNSQLKAGLPAIKPIGIANLTSPKPSHLPLLSE